MRFHQRSQDKVLLRHWYAKKLRKVPESETKNGPPRSRVSVHPYERLRSWQLRAKSDDQSLISVETD